MAVSDTKVLSCSGIMTSGWWVNWLLSNDCVEDFEFDISDWFVTQGPLPCPTLEALNNGVLH